MKLKIYTMFLALFGASLMACQNTQVNPADGVARPQIIGGVEATPGAYPSIVEVRRDGAQYCAGTILNATTILTAAHCTVNIEAARFQVVAGQHDRTVVEVSTQTRNVSLNMPHPDYNANTFSNDIAILRLSTPLTFNARVQPTLLGNIANVTGNLRTLGWGQTVGDDPASVANRLRQVDLQRADQAACDTAMRNHYASLGFNPIAVDATMFCAGLPLTNQGACHGDSGGPIFDIATGLQVGIVSWGADGRFINGCNMFSVYNDLSRYALWIASVSRSTGELFAGAGGIWGTWGAPEFCAAGEFAYGAQTRIEANQGRGDDTALNSIRLLCRPEGSSALPETSIISSKQGFWGDWSQWSRCQGSDLLASYELKVEGNQGGNKDDTTANAVKLGCRSVRSGVSKPTYSLLPGEQIWGSWVGYREAPVGKAICGIQTKIEDQQGGGDDTALNDVKFYYCDLETPADPPPPVTYRLNVTFSGTGVVASSAIQCGNNVPNCTATLPQGYSETLNVSSGTVLSWSGCDSSTATTCTFTMNADRQIRVAFR
jgi:hypothetical protein